jgi:hypothetical protein
MSFDFYGEYKNYPNLELLKIMRQPGDYQPEAVAAASQILNDRQIATEEFQSLDQSLQDLEEDKREKMEKIERLKTEAATFLSPILQPQKKIDPSQWLSYFLVVIGLQYVWTLIGIAKKLIRLHNRENFFWVDYLDFFSVFYIPFIFYLLIKKRRWGWILLFADNFGSLILSLSETYIFFKYQYIHHGNIVSFIVPILIRAAFAYFLWNHAIAELFCVDTRTKKQTAWITAGGTLLFMGVFLLVRS